MTFTKANRRGITRHWIMAVLLGVGLTFIFATSAPASPPAPNSEPGTRNSELSSTSATRPAVTIIQAPPGCFVPDVAVDAGGTLHMVYALDKNAWYVQSKDQGATFTQPVQVNSEGTVGFTMGERGPKMSVGSDGVIHVVWQKIWKPGEKTFVRYSRSRDGGKTFEAVKDVSAMPGCDGVTVAADGKGNVIAFWHVMQPVQKEVPQATWLYLARSADNGATFGDSEPLKITGLTSLACSMCMMCARFTADGQVCLAYRTAVDNIRDFYVLKAPATENKFTAVRVNNDNWKLDTCPMCGPELTFDANGRALCAFMSRHKVYWSVANKELAAFQLHVGTPAGENDEIYPAAVGNRSGDVLMVWQIGPMAIDRTATVKWARYSRDGKFTGAQGTLGTTKSGTKATAFVGADDQFYIVTTAKAREK